VPDRAIPILEEEPVETNPSVLVARVPSPDWLRATLPAEAAEALSAKWGEDPLWGCAIPGMFRALASPLSFEPLPETPDPSDPHRNALGYWTALMHMLLYSLGWARPDRGLRWWYDTGRPTDDHRLALLDHVWYRDGHLEDFALWVSRGQWVLGEAQYQLAELTDHHDDGEPVEPHPDWTAAERTRDGSVFDGGTDPYHLSVHTSGPLAEPRGEPLLLRSGHADRRGVLLLDSMVGW
jgi:hypothetical protein